MLTFKIYNIDLEAVNGDLHPAGPELYILLCVPRFRQFRVFRCVNNARFGYVKVVSSSKWFNGTMLIVRQISYSTNAETLTCPVPFKGV